MVATTITAPAAVPAAFSKLVKALATAARFTGHLVAALLGVIFLGSGTEH